MNNNDLLIRELKKSRQDDTTSFNILDFLHAFGSPLEAAAYGKLFWPDFTEVEDMIFLAATVEDDADRARVLTALAIYNGDRQETERSFNFIEVPTDLFGRRVGESTEEVDRVLASILQETWSARLQSLYPNRELSVELVDSGDNGGELGIIFFQPQHRAKG